MDESLEKEYRELRKLQAQSEQIKKDIEELRKMAKRLSNDARLKLTARDLHEGWRGIQDLATLEHVTSLDGDISPETRASINRIAEAIIAAGGTPGHV